MSRSAIDSESCVLEWMSTNDFEIIDDCQIEVFRHGCVDVYSDDSQWKVVACTDSKARLIRYSMTFDKSTPAKIIKRAIADAIADCFKNRSSLSA